MLEGEPTLQAFVSVSVSKHWPGTCKEIGRVSFLTFLGLCFANRRSNL